MPEARSTPRPISTAATIIVAAEERLVVGRAHATCLRYGRARGRLEAHLEELGEQMLLEAGIAMLEVERELEPVGALLRVATGEDLLYALPSFIGADRSPVLPTSDLRAQLRLAEECHRVMIVRRLVDSRHACASLEVDGALRRARASIRNR